MPLQNGQFPNLRSFDAVVTEASAASGVSRQKIILSLDRLSAAVAKAKPCPACGMVVAIDRVCHGEHGQPSVPVPDKVRRRLRPVPSAPALDAAAAFRAVGTDEIRLKDRCHAPTVTEAVPTSERPSRLLDMRLRLGNDGEHFESLTSEIRRRFPRNLDASAAVCLATHEIVVSDELCIPTVAQAVENPAAVPAGISNRFFFRFDREHPEAPSYDVVFHL